MHLINVSFTLPSHLFVMELLFSPPGPKENSSLYIWPSFPQMEFRKSWKISGSGKKRTCSAHNFKQCAIAVSMSVFSNTAKTSSEAIWGIAKCEAERHLRAGEKSKHYRHRHLYCRGPESISTGGFGGWHPEELWAGDSHFWPHPDYTTCGTKSSTVSRPLNVMQNVKTMDVAKNREWQQMVHFECRTWWQKKNLSHWQTQLSAVSSEGL